MTPARWRQVNETFLAVAGAAPAERAAHLARLAGGDPDLVREVEQMLAGDARAADERFLQDSPLHRIRAAAGRDSRDTHTSAAASGRNRTPTAGPIQIPDFDLIRRLDGGGFGDVWLACSRSGVYRAVKIMPRNLLSDVEIRGLRTFETFAGRHANLIDVRHVGETPEWLYYVMELADGYSAAPTFDPADYVPRTLQSDLRRRGAIPPAEAVAIARQMLAGLGHLHAAGLLHRDIKPANIVFVGGSAKLADIGLLAHDDAVRRGGLTPDYAPPGGVVDRSGDLFCVGRVLAELLCGELPPIGRALPGTLSTERCAAVAPYTALLERACAAEPAARFQSAEEFDRALSARVKSANPTLTDARRAPRSEADRRRHRRLMHWRNGALGGIAVVFIATALLYQTPPARGTLHMTVVPSGKSTDAEIEVEKEFPLKARDQVRFRIKLDRPGYALLAIIAPAGEPTIVYPPAAAGAERIRQADVPPDGGVWELPEGSGCILAVLLVSDEPINDRNAILALLSNLPAPDISAEWMIRADDDRPQTIKTLKEERFRGPFDPAALRRARPGAIEQIRARFKDRFPHICILAVPQIRT